MRLLKIALAAATLLGHHALAQVHTDCDPLQKECPADPAWGTSHLFHFNATPSNDLWETTAGTVTYDADKGAGFTIAKQGDSPTIRTKFYFFFGRTEILLKVAPGRGVVSSMMWLSDDLDEVDWEFLGSNTTFATTNYFGKGRQDWRNGGAHPMTGMQDDYHNYTTVWTKEQIDWFIDGNHVRTLVAKDANNTENYPQTPMRMSVGIWAGGDPSLPEGTRKWAGGDTDYGSGPYTMYLKAARVTDFSSGKEYSYGDRSGSWHSIKIAAGNSTALEALNKEPDKSISEKWAALPSSTKIGIYAGAGGFVALAGGALLFYFLRQRRRGAREARLAEERAAAERHEMEHFQKKGINPDGFSEYGHEYDAREVRKGGYGDADSYHVPETTAASPLGEGAWGAAAAAGGMHHAQNHRMASPAPSARGPGSPRGFDFGVPPSPGPSPSGPLPSPNRNQMRSESGPGAYGNMARMQSPGPPPARSFTDIQRGPSPGHPRGGY
ncbi:hypothetical protein JDV02_004683 [Purpureocillium takamizusanense]|uniref:chitinase n=1 Tax=Purpureocillium takamizusanense TaxID=2060973 RepID=A0A9Q8QGV7_9HYPO|nr:uncharacterized protein JDV02_004683 [Purpureocillium takamizusanense]UNI18412.1 hypothetical protein JDV02_004683 [Purpureocillium takamizusanense]